jgi:hypothetical protein
MTIRDEYEELAAVPEELRDEEYCQRVKELYERVKTILGIW